MSSATWLARAALPLLVSLGLSGGLGGCQTEAACFADCHGDEQVNRGGRGGAGGSTGGLMIGVGNEGPTLGGKSGASKGGTGGLEPTPTECEDDVDFETDLDNCGECGNHCAFVGGDAMCIDGECVLGMCDAEHVDLDGDDDNGCEYVCVPTNDGVELCNGRDEDCDGEIDNGFDLSSDPDNCGVCGNGCELLHASSDCDPGNGAPSCAIIDCNPGWFNADGVDANGCEYSCVKTGAGGVPCDENDPSCGQELCDEYDNDCNGVINDGNEAMGGPEGGSACTDFCEGGVCRGECTAGIRSCVGTQLVCVPGKGPTLEVCDNKDNDCDGKLDDEEFDLTSDPNNCGGCGVSCINALPNAVAQCTTPPNGQPTCSILACKPGYKDLDPSKPGCEQCPKFPTSAETCNGIDDDCDGIIDNPAAIAAQQPALLPFCNNGRNMTGTPCDGTTITCGGTSGWVCNYPTTTGVEVDPVTRKVRVVEQACDAKDGNCDGQLDEAFLNKGQSCNVGTGVCGRTSTFQCKADHTGTECAASSVATDAKDELCNGLDDNCDGQVDERVPVAGTICYNGGTHDCLGYTEPTVKVGNTWVYTYEASRPDATLDDPGLYSVRSCSKANVLPWTSISQVDAAAACAAVPTSDPNTKMRLCSEAEWQTACLAGQSATTQTWAYSTAPTAYDDLVCNDAAAGKDAPWATAFNNLQGNKRCRTSTQIWDMSGNVAEWTGTCITVLGKQYCRVRGGSFLSLGPATACNFSFVLDKPDFLNFDLGFRCCSSVAP